MIPAGQALLAMEFTRARRWQRRRPDLVRVPASTE